MNDAMFPVVKEGHAKKKRDKRKFRASSMK